MNIDLSQETILVTGASRGIGEATARQLASCGAELILTATKPEAEHNLKELYDFPFKFLPVDFLCQQSTETFLSEVRALKRLTGLVNNAGLTRHRALQEARLQDWEDTCSVNLRAPFFVTQAAAEPMKKSGSGKIVNISSIWGHLGPPGKSVYAATKFGIRGITKSTAAELSRYNILVNTVSPSLTLTDMVTSNWSDEQIKAFEEKVPLGRVARPEEVANAILFFLSPLNTYISGQCLIVDGGYTIV